MNQGAVVTVVLAILLPLIVAVGVMASETLTSPSHAERRNRTRTPGSLWDRVEAVSGCAFGILVATALGVALWYLWEQKPGW